MKGIEKITGRILAEAKEEAESLKADAREKAAQILAEYEEQAKAVYDSRLETGKAEAAAAADRKSRAAGLNARKDVLGTKQDLIEQAYAMARKSILRMPEDEYLSFLAEKASQASVTGSEQILLNAKDKEKYGAKLIPAANAILASQGRNASLALSEETVPINGGLFLKQGDVSVNCSVDALLNICREEMDVKVAKILFG